ncbi:hypothetical protein OsI_02741 [Oryza sativa Indica Group]|uniref:Uncharacterized protein n=1 Tax=Oryza sativa subsp. indica TaxID=39946 RepID=B8ABH4_ORYSI|nr:hypothetical protein OsI_02741 [Oryza sativa Indica Group]
MVPNKPLRTIEVLEITEEEAVGREEDLLALAQLAGISTLYNLASPELSRQNR